MTCLSKQKRGVVDFFGDILQSLKSINISEIIMGETTMFIFHKLRKVLTTISFILGILYINYELNSTLFNIVQKIINNVNYEPNWYLYIHV